MSFAHSDLLAAWGAMAILTYADLVPLEDIGGPLPAGQSRGRRARVRLRELAVAAVAIGVAVCVALGSVDHPHDRATIAAGEPVSKDEQKPAMPRVHERHRCRCRRPRLKRR